MTRAQQENTLAESRGFTAITDPRRGGSFCKFHRNDWVIWECARLGEGVFWQIAQLVNEHYTRHEHFPKLENAFDRVVELDG